MIESIMKRFFYLSLGALMVVLCVSCQKEKKPAAEFISLSAEELELSIGQQRQLLVILPKGANEEDVQWSSDKPNIVSVSETGEVKASPFNDGNAVVTARWKDLEASCNVRVKIPVQWITFPTGSTDGSISMNIGQQYSSYVMIKPTTATDGDNIVFENTNDEVAEFKQDADYPTKFTLTAKQLGDTKVTVRCGGEEAVLFVFVEEIKVTKLTLDRTTLTLDPGQTRSIGATPEPSNAANKKVWWRSSNPAVVTVEDGIFRGTVKALRSGKAKITAFCGEATASCDVTVTVPEGAVDLGLSVLWAECNIWADSYDKAGRHISWGGYERPSEYSWKAYSWCEHWDDYGEGYYVFSRYSKKDNMYSLADENYLFDAARGVLGGSWRIPTAAEFEELITNCDFRREASPSGWGLRITSKIPGYTNRSIFLPAGNTYQGTLVDPIKDEGGYWTNELIPSHPEYAVSLIFWDSSASDGDISKSFQGALKPAYRYYGFNVRPVW